MEEETLEVRRLLRIPIWFPDGERGGGGREGYRASVAGVGVLRELFGIGDRIGGGGRSEDGRPGLVAGGGGGGRRDFAGDRWAGKGGGGAILRRKVLGLYRGFESVAGEEGRRSKGEFFDLVVLILVQRLNLYCCWFFLSFHCERLCCSVVLFDLVTA